MLEEVSVLCAFLNSGVGDHVVAVLGDHQLDALLSQDVDDLCQDLSVGGGGSCHLQGDGLCCGVFCGSLFAAAAGAQANSHGQSQDQSQDLFHFGFSSL